MKSIRTRILRFWLFAVLTGCGFAGTAAGENSGPIPWQNWSDQVFTEARASHRYVLMDLEAVWCHWCHVMDQTTYRDDAVARLMAKRFIAVKVDQDARPDLARRFEMYGWPATIVFDGDGRVIAHYRGYYDPATFAHLLNAVIDDPSPLHNDEETDNQHPYAAKALLAPAVHDELERRFRGSLDPVGGGLAQFQKFLERDSVEYSLWLAGQGDSDARATVTTTLNAARAIIDPVWGGMYQYSTDRDWQHPHFEKIMSVQANALRLYSLAYQQFRDTAYLEAARSVHGYLERFLLSGDGAFYTSQDADLVQGTHSAEYFALSDAERVAQGIPRIDEHRYARENGWVIESLAQYYSATGDANALREAKAAAAWIGTHRLAANGLYRHGESDQAGTYLADTLAMARAHLALYTVTGERSELIQAQRGAALLTRFAARQSPGFMSSLAEVHSRTAVPNVDDNIDVARFSNLLYRYTGERAHEALAQRALRLLDTERIALRFGTTPGILLANAEYASEPLHITVVGAHDDPAAQALFHDALAQPAVYRRIDWWDPSAGPLVHSDVKFPKLDRASAFVCTQNYCSLPLFSGQEIALQVAQSTPAKP